jgi:hypothetical protein
MYKLMNPDKLDCVTKSMWDTYWGGYNDKLDDNDADYDEMYKTAFFNYFDDKFARSNYLKDDCLTFD